jgi:hypothetical protein
MSKFKDVIIESLTSEDNIQNLLNIVKPELTEQCQGLTVNEDGTIRIKLFDSAYTIKLQPISITTQEEEEYHEENEQMVNNQDENQPQPIIDNTVLATIDNLSKSNNPQIANSAKNTMSGLSKKVAEVGTEMINKTNKILADLKK